MRRDGRGLIFGRTDGEIGQLHLVGAADTRASLAEVEELYTGESKRHTGTLLFNETASILRSATRKCVITQPLSLK